MSDVIRVGLIGASWFVKGFYLPGLLGRDDFQVRAVCSRSGTTAAAVAADLGGTARVYTDYREMLAREELDAAIIVTPDGEHHPMVMAALANGLHVLCDKPLSTSHQRAAEMYQAAAAAGRVHMVNFCFRLAPGAYGMRQLLRSGDLGPIYHLEAAWSADYALVDPRSWKYTRTGGGSGAMADMGVHALDLLRWLAGDIRRVCADAAVAIPERPEDEDGEPALTENWDVAHALLRFDAGQPGVIRSSRVDTTGYHGEIRIACAEGGLTLRITRDLIQVLLQQPGHPERVLEEQPYRESLRAMAIAQINMFHQAILDGGPAEEDQDRFPTFRDGERAQAAIDAIDRSARTGGWVEVE